MNISYILILDASCDNKDKEIEIISATSKYYGIIPVLKKVERIEDIISILKETKYTYDYIYLASHGTCDSFGNKDDDKIKIDWMDFGLGICYSKVINQNAVLFHSCCRGGATQVCFQMFGSCEQIQYVCGPLTEVVPVELFTCFNNFLFFKHYRKISAVKSAEKIEYFNDVKFVCMDRNEMVVCNEYIDYMNRIENDMKVKDKFISNFFNAA